MKRSTALGLSGISLVALLVASMRMSLSLDLIGNSSPSSIRKATIPVSWQMGSDSSAASLASSRMLLSWALPMSPSISSRAFFIASM